MQSNGHEGRLQLLRSTAVYQGACSCGWRGGLTDKGRAWRSLAAHLTTVLDIAIDADTFRPPIEVEDWKRTSRS